MTTGRTSTSSKAVLCRELCFLRGVPFLVELQGDPDLFEHPYSLSWKFRNVKIVLIFQEVMREADPRCGMDKSDTKRRWVGC